MRLVGPLLELTRLQIERDREPDCAAAHRALGILRKKGGGRDTYARTVLGGCLLAAGRRAQAAPLIRGGAADLRKREPNHLHALSAADAYLARLAAAERR
ncbi:hypothetical protein [Luteimonas sp. R10]|uniref:hypothetical protein n=1 Tax=Luteimonas sp. R10 TaxID=3108176 RepID=UPI00308A040E|nr:hypothetical protein U3649_09305 [Luteimonas sp. R10]